MFLAKDFIETPENLIFAVVSYGLEQNKVLCFLRYAPDNGQTKKVSTTTANRLLQTHHPEYLHYSPVLDAHLHAVPTERIIKHYQPKRRLQQLLTSNQPADIETDIVVLCQLLQAYGVDLMQCGITGSLLIGAQHASSDLDFVCYERAVFQQCRSVMAALIERGIIQELNEQDWQDSYQRRNCELNFSDYLWHEKRKANKGMINGRKFDLSLVNANSPAKEHYQKYGLTTIHARVLDDVGAFDYPAEFIIDHAEISSVVSFTATYTGQTFKGECIEVTGQIEQDAQGVKRLVVGSSREAHGEYIKVIPC